MKKPKISFCTTCMGRLDHVRQTFLRNIEDNRDYIEAGGEVEFVLLNYGGEEETDRWVRENLQDLIEEGIVVYASYPAAEHFYMAHAKNMAHRIASGDILCNIDADNFAGEGFAAFIAEKFASGAKCLRASSVLRKLRGQKVKEGLGGKIVVSKDDFEYSRGYDETFFGWGGEDNDFAQRLARHHGRLAGDIPLKFQECLEHSDERRFEHYDEEAVRASRAAREKLKGKNVWTSRVGRVVALFTKVVQQNPKGNVGCGTVYLNFSEQPTEIEPLPPLYKGLGF